MLRYYPKRWVFFFAIKMVITDSSGFVATGNSCLKEFLSLKIGSWKAGVKYTCRMWQSNLWALKWLKSTGFTWLYPACLKGLEGYPTCWWITFIATNPHSLSVYPYVCRSVPPGTPFLLFASRPFFWYQGPCALPNTSAGKESTMSMMVARLHPILLMVQKSQGQPPFGSIPKPWKWWWYLPYQLVSGITSMNRSWARNSMNFLHFRMSRFLGSVLRTSCKRLNAAGHGLAHLVKHVFHVERGLSPKWGWPKSSGCKMTFF